MTLLNVEDLRTYFHTRPGLVRAVDGVDFALEAGRTLALVGESGCGKTVTALSIIGLLPPRARIETGSIHFDGRELVGIPERELDEIRGDAVGMVFQDPLTSLNPAFTVGQQLAETLRRHQRLSRRAARKRAVELLGEVRIASPQQRLDDYPHRFSGGMRQRVMIALAIACKPQLLIADEPTTALDVTIQAQILDLLEELQLEHNMAMIIITHDMGVVAETAAEVAVMYAGQIVERAEVGELFARPEHPYTEALLGSLPRFEDAGMRAGRFTTIPGQPPELINPPQNCRFADRCPYAHLPDECTAQPQALREVRPAHWVRSAHPRTDRAISRLHTNGVAVNGQ